MLLLQVNRLSRELSHLRAQHNASVASNASSTSASASASGAEQPAADTHLLSGTGFTIPSTRRHHRSSSNTSTRSQQAAANLASSVDSRAGSGFPVPISPVPARPIVVPGPASLSRQNSAASHRSRTSSPAPAHLLLGDSSTYSYFQQQQRNPTSVPAAAAAAAAATTTTTAGSLATPGSAGYLSGSGAAEAGSGSQLSPGLLPATSRYEETAFFRSELESTKRENDALKRRVRELERMLRERRASDASATRPRSESVGSTTTASAASVAGTPASGWGMAGGSGSIAGPRDGGGAARPVEAMRERGMTNVSVAGSVGVGVPEEEVRVGESAASAGLRATEAQGA